MRFFENCVMEKVSQKISAFLLVVGCGLSFVALAQVNSGSDTVKAVRITDSVGGVIVILEGNNNGCGGDRIFFNSSGSHKDGITSLAITALVSGREFQASYITCTDSPWANTAHSDDATLL